MSDHKNADKGSLTQTGRARRRFLEGTALAAVGTSAAALLNAQQAPSTGSSSGSAPATCPSIPTPMKDVEGKVAFVTGGNSGIGLGITRAFADAGMKVVITYRTKKNLDEAMEHLKKYGNRIHAVSVDVTDRAAMEKAADETEKVFGKVHVIVNNAGVGVAGPLSTATYDDWDWGMSVNLDGVFNGIRTFLPRIRKHGEGGHVIATSSLAGLIAHGNLGVYTATKFAVVGMMEALRTELYGSNIGVTVFCPGVVNTNIANSARNRPEEFSDSAVRPAPSAPPQGPAPARPAGPSPGMDPLEAGQLVLRGMRNNDLYVLTTPEFEAEFKARGEAIVASIPPDVVSPEARIAFGRMIVGPQVYAQERDRKLCELAKLKKT